MFKNAHIAICLILSTFWSGNFPAFSQENAALKDSSENLTPTGYLWTIDVISLFEPAEGSSENLPGYDFEIFDEFNIRVYNNATKTEINETLENYRNKDTYFSKLEIIFLNSGHHFVEIYIGEELYYSGDNEELSMFFYPYESHHYKIMIHPPVLFHFFYVETSGGINNLRYLRGHLDNIIESNQPFLVYYNGPSGAATFSSPDQLGRFYNIVFTAITQPPAAVHELRRVVAALEQFSPQPRWNVDLVVNFYIAEISYDRLIRQMVDPFSQKLTQEREFRRVDFSLFTDFDIRNKNNNYTYINLLNTIKQ